MTDYNNIQQIFGDPLHDFGHTETQGTSNAIKIAVTIALVLTAAYALKHYIDAQMYKKGLVLMKE